MTQIPRRAPEFTRRIEDARHGWLQQQPVFDGQPVHAGEFTRVVRGGNQLRVERVERDEHVERPDSAARLLRRVSHPGRTPGFGIAKGQHGTATVIGKNRSRRSQNHHGVARTRAVALTTCQSRGMVEA